MACGIDVQEPGGDDKDNGLREGTKLQDIADFEMVQSKRRDSEGICVDNIAAG